MNKTYEVWYNPNKRIIPKAVIICIPNNEQISNNNWLSDFKS